MEKPAERRAAAIQALGYVADPTIGADVVIITDGKTWAHHRDPSADMEVGEQSALDLGLAMPEPEDHFIWRENEVDTFIRILGLIATVRTDPVTATNVADKLVLVGQKSWVSLANCKDARPAGTRRPYGHAFSTMDTTRGSLVWHQTSQMTLGPQ